MTATVTPTSPTISIHLRNFAPDAPPSWEPLLVRARAADAAGIDRVVVSDHVAFGDHLDAYSDPARGGSAGATQPTGPDGHWLEPITVLSMVAGMTRHVRLQTAVLLAALRRPAVLAKQLATLDVLSGGRVDAGVGVGWQREEYEACGLDYGRRGAILDDTLATLTALWVEPVASIDNETVRFEGIHAMPKPLRSDGVPIWVSGTLHQRVIDRIVRFGSGWIPWGADARDPVAGLDRLRPAFERAGRTMESFGVAGSLPIVRDAGGSIDLAATMDGVPPLVAGGVTDFSARVDIPADHDAAVERLSTVVEAFRSAVGRDSSTVRDSSDD